ncbi:hypothetical protein 035JT004_68 [Bacillus phage 035JT004]|nr:hypothetical protein 035JT004_68 [Bacillus phage 035JT004]
MNKKECCRCCYAPKLSLDGLAIESVASEKYVDEVVKKHTAVFFGTIQQNSYELDYRDTDYLYRGLPAEKILKSAHVVETVKRVPNKAYLIRGEHEITGPVKSVGDRVLLEELEHPVTIREVATRTDGTVVYYTDYIKHVEDPNLSTKQHVEQVLNQLKELAVGLNRKELEEKNKEISRLQDHLLEFKNKKKGFWKRG